MKDYRRTTSCWLISQVLCFCLLLQGSGIAQALPLQPKKTFISKSELEATPEEGAASASDKSEGSLERFLDRARATADDAGVVLRHLLEGPWFESAMADEPPLRVAQAGGTLPLPSRLMSALLASSSQSRAAPPSPPDLGAGAAGDTPPAELAGLRSKSTVEQVPLLADLNLISIPKEPDDTDPAAVFAGVAGELQKVTAHDTCDPADPWKVYDPADPAASDLTKVDHRIGMWVSMTAAAALPSNGTLPATTTLELCEGWNLIGFPAAEPRHPHAALASIAGKWQRVFGYDAFDPEDPWEFFDPTVPDWASDLRLMKPGRGYWILVDEAVTLEIRNQGPPPTVAIASPADLAVVTEPTEILGTVDSDRLASWTLTYRPIGDGDAVTLATGSAPVASGALATFDPTLLLNGLYELELTATDVQGQQVTDQVAVSVEGQMKIGHFTLSFVDLAIPVSGLDLEIIRTYDSRDKQPRDFGVGWNLDIRQGSYHNNRRPGDGWQLQTGFVACDTALESKSHLTVVRLSDQEVYRFALRLHSGEPRVGGGCQADARFDFIDGPLPGTTLEILGNDQVYWETGADRVIDVDTLETYEPENVRLTTRDGRIFELNLGDGVTRVEDLNGNQLSITPAGITHSSGKGIVFERDAEGRILRITDPMDRTMSYSYDAAGDLASFTDRAGAATRFNYDAGHLLLDIDDRRGVKAIRNEYDAEGRLVRHVDAFGKVIELGHDRANRREVVTNRLGASRALEYDARGNVIRETDELGKVTARAFDPRDNLLSETDPLGRTTTYSYTANNDIAAMTDPLGHVTRFTYGGRGEVLTVTDPRGGVTSNVYDGGGNLTRTTDALGKVTSFTYDAAGNLLSATDALGYVTSFEYDAFGNLTREIDALGHETVSTYDSAGNHLTETRGRTLPDGSTEALVTSFVYDGLDRVTSTTAADGSSTVTTYDLLGKVTSQTDPLGRVTAMTYDLAGRLVGTSYPDGTSESRSYDDEGRLTSQIDRGGRTTSFLYDPSGRLLTTTYPDGSTTSNNYDDAGQLVATTDARGNTTSYAYDAAGRRTAVIDPLGNGPTFTYDEADNQTGVTDAKNQTTAFTYDALGRLILTTYPDGTTSQVAYDDVGRRIAETDQAGITTEFVYDGLGRLASVKDALEQVTSYTYNEAGNHLTQTNANGHTTSFEIDRLGRQTARVFPDGSRETMVYNADGTLASHTDFNGATRTFEYDAAGRLIRRAYPDDSEVTFTYTSTGQRASATDARGTTTYSYDSRDRLTEKVDPTGYSLGYTYDAQGNRASLTATVGAEVFTTTYTYDELNRLATVTDSQGGVTSLGYDANGNQAKLAYPNGVATTYTYDGLNRLIELRSATSVGDVLQSYQYTLGPAGNRTRIDEHDGTSKHYQYDALYRLTQDRVTDAADALVYQRDFAYDPVGNRLQQTIDEGSGPDVVGSTYDDRDRLLTAQATTYGWDINGNLTSQNGTTYTWGFENRLTSADLDTGTLVENSYDGDGNRVRSAITPPGGQTATIDFIIDTTGVLSHVTAEIVNGSVGTLYIRAGDQLIALLRPASGMQRYYQHDALGSIRILSDDTGTATDRYSYTAHGESTGHDQETVQPFKFAGEPFSNELGFYYNRARWLDVAAGRFIGADPWSGWKYDPHSLHSYLYARADPAGQTDPSGYAPIPQSIAALAVAAQVQIARLSLQVGAAFAVGGLGAAWRVWRTMGVYAQTVARQVIVRYGRVTIAQGRQIINRIPDYLLTASNGLKAWLEIKWNLPSRSGEALTRLVGQVTEAWQTGKGQVVVWSLREPTLQQIRLVHGHLGVLASKTQFVHGVSGLYQWLHLYFG